MPRGGARPGAGRKKGSQSSKTKARLALVERLNNEGLSPLDVMLAAMKEAVDRRDMESAAGFAKDAAPYLHPRLQAVMHARQFQAKASEVSCWTKLMVPLAAFHLGWVRVWVIK